MSLGRSQVLHEWEGTGVGKQTGLQKKAVYTLASQALLLHVEVYIHT